jgi:hypothetical protein
MYKSIVKFSIIFCSKSSFKSWKPVIIFTYTVCSEI